MKVLIIEDETAAAQNLCSILRQIDSGIEVVDTLDTVTDSVEWFGNNPAPDLVFMDIHLSDGESFRIFDSVEIDSPIVFTTAYDQYALDAFKVNSIDYLLKPISEREVVRALNKWKTLTSSDRKEYNARVSDMAQQRRSGKPVFLVRFRDRIIPLGCDDIAFFYTSNERVSAYTFGGDRYPVEHTLESLSGILPAETFFRANRQFIVSRAAVKDIAVWFGSRLSLNLTVDAPEKIIISKARVPEFKTWLTDSHA